MSQAKPPPDLPDPQIEAPQRLRANALGIWYVGGMAMAWMGLAIATYFVIPFMEQAAGPITPLIFLLLIVLMLPTAISYAVMNKRRPSAGGAFTWLWESTSPPVGLWLGWLVFTLYGIIGVVLQPLIGGLTFNALLGLFGVQTGFWTGLIGAWLTVAAVAVVSLTGIRRSARTVLVFLLIEAGFVLALSAFIIVDQGQAGHLSAVPLTPSALRGGFEGFKVAVIFGIFSIAGFDIVATSAEETKSPRSLVPRATIWVTIVSGVFWAITSYALAVAVPIKTMDHFLASASQSGAVYLVAGQYIGWAKVFVIITSISAILAIMSAVMVAAARMLYALAREGFAPRWFGHLHKKHETPFNAQLAMIGLAVVLPAVLAVWQGDNLTNAYGWLGEVYVFFVLVPYMFVNIGCFVYHWRYHRSDFNWLLYAVLPGVGLIIDAWLLYEAFFRAYLGLPFTGPGGIGSSIAWVAIAWGALGLV
ncbi:MAG TPA: APC family permease, partial [Chloroflexota bacterium]|nr:APC family permease [Chloroflexota bacterium]